MTTNKTLMEALGIKFVADEVTTIKIEGLIAGIVKTAQLANTVFMANEDLTSHGGPETLMDDPAQEKRLQAAFLAHAELMEHLKTVCTAVALSVTPETFAEAMRSAEERTTVESPSIVQ